MRTCLALHAIESCIGGRLRHFLREGQGGGMGCTWKESPVDGPSDWETLIYGWQALDCEGSHSAGRLQRYKAAQNFANEEFIAAQTLCD